MNTIKAVCIVLLCLMMTGCQQRCRGTRTVKETWDNTTIVDNPVVEVAKVFKNQPTGSTGKTQVRYKYNSRTKNNMGMYHGPGE